MLKRGAHVHERPRRGAKASPNRVRGGMPVQEADRVLDLIVGGRTRGHGDAPEIGPRPNEFLYASGETVLAPPLHGGLGAEVHAEDAEFAAGRVELDPAFHFLEVETNDAGAELQRDACRLLFGG